MLRGVKGSSTEKVDFTKTLMGRYIVGTDYIDEIGLGRQLAEAEFKKLAKGAKGLHSN